MDHEEKFWLLFWGILATLFIVITSQITGCVAKKNELETNVVNNAIQKGVDPIVAKCAMMINSQNKVNNNTNDTMICLNAAKR